MKIKKQDGHYLVIASTFGERLIGVFEVVIGIILLAIFFSSLFFPNITMDHYGVYVIVISSLFIYNSKQ